MSDDRYERLRDAVIAYDHALRLAGAALDQDSPGWIDSDDLDHLWAAVKAAAALEDDDAASAA